LEPFRHGGDLRAAGPQRPREAFTYLKDCSISREEFKARIEGQLFFAGAGTWQKLWEGGGALGFGAPKDKTTQVVDRVAAEKVVPIELLMRFAWPPSSLNFQGRMRASICLTKQGCQN